MQLKVGATLPIYQRPLTKEDYEGKATLVAFLDSEIYEEGILEVWTVRFPGAESTYTREILVTP